MDNSHDRQRSDAESQEQRAMWSRVQPGDRLQLAGPDAITGTVVRVDMAAETVRINHDNGDPGADYTWDDVAAVVINDGLAEPARDTSEQAKPFGEPTGETKVYFNERPDPEKSLAMVSLERLMHGPERLQEIAGRYLNSHLMAHGERVAMGGVVYEVTYVNLGKMRWTLVPVGIVVDAADAAKRGLLQPGHVEQELAEEKERAARFNALDVIVRDCPCFQWTDPAEDRDAFGHAKGCEWFQGIQEVPSARH